MWFYLDVSVSGVEKRQKKEKNFTVFVIFFSPKRRRNCVVQLPPEVEKVGKRRRRFEAVKLKEEGKGVERED